jgi:hypothetical protein
MSDWLHNLPVPLMALAIFAFIYLLAIIIFAAVSALATGEPSKIIPGDFSRHAARAGYHIRPVRCFHRRTGLEDNDRASAAVSREASALRAVMLLAAGLPPEQESRLHDLIRGYVEQTATVEWPMMARQTASLRAAALAEALQFVVSITPQGPGQQTAQREIISALGSALDARRQRIIVSQAEVNSVKWWSLYLQAICELLVIAVVHCGNRLASGIAMAVRDRRGHLGTADRRSRPFTGQISIGPEPLLQIMPDRSASR